jgi:hypothetical protein
MPFFPCCVLPWKSFLGLYSPPEAALPPRRRAFFGRSVYLGVDAGERPAGGVDEEGGFFHGGEFGGGGGVLPPLAGLIIDTDNTLFFPIDKIHIPYVFYARNL